jgi:hypothetical protein
MLICKIQRSQTVTNTVNEILTCVMGDGGKPVLMVRRKECSVLSLGKSETEVEFMELRHGRSKAQPCTMARVSIPIKLCIETNLASEMLIQP